MAGFRKVAIGKVLHIADMSKSNTVTLLAHDIRYMITRIGIQTAGARIRQL